MSRNDSIDIECVIHHETDGAILVSDDGDEKTARWLTKSKIDYETDYNTGITTVTMPEWLAMREGFG